MTDTVLLVIRNIAAQKQKVWKVAALWPFLDQNFPWIKISQGIQKVDLKYFKFNYNCSTFYKFVRQQLEVNYNLEK